MELNFSSGNSSIGDTNCIPALLTNMSIEPKYLVPSTIIFRISSGTSMSALEWMQVMLCFEIICSHILSSSALFPRPLMTKLAPLAAKSFAIASPIPLVDPVMSAVLFLKIIVSPKEYLSI